MRDCESESIHLGENIWVCFWILILSFAQCLASGSKVPASVYGFHKSPCLLITDWQNTSVPVTLSSLPTPVLHHLREQTWQNIVPSRQNKRMIFNHHSAQVIDCRIYFTLHRIQRVHLLQSGVIYKPYGLTVSFCWQQIQSALMQKHVLSLRERQISTSENDHLSLVYTTIFATYSEICQFLMGLPGFAPCTSSHCAVLRPGHIYPQSHDPSYAEWDDPGL